MAKQQRKQISARGASMAGQEADTVYKIVDVVGVSVDPGKAPAATPWRRQPARCATCASPK
jgi:hypothetical protein